MVEKEVSEELVAEVKHYREQEGLGVREVSEATDLSMQEVTKIINSDAYKEAEIQVADQPEATGEDRLDQILDQVYQWGLKFSKTEYFEELTDEQKIHSEHIVQCFAEFMYSYYGLEPHGWRRRDFGEGLEECCLEIFPRKVSAEESYFRSIGPVLAAFFSFVEHRGLMEGAQSLARRVRNIEDGIVGKASDPSNWGFAKSMLMAAKDAGVDTHNEEELNKFLKSRMYSLEPGGERGKHWTREDMEGLSTREIVQKLEDFGVNFDEERFLEVVEDSCRASEVVDYWQRTDPVTAAGLDQDFLLLAAMILWERLAPEVVSAQQINKKMEEGYNLLEEGKTKEACSRWLDAWGLIKKIKPSEVTTLVEIEDLLQIDRYVQNWCQDLEMELQNAGQEDEKYYRKLIEFVQEFFETFPDLKEGLICQNMMVAVASSYFGLGKSEKSEKKYEELTQKYPDSVYGYLSWGDRYCQEGSKPDPDYKKAEERYLSGLENALKGDLDGSVEAALNRLEDLYEKAGEPERIKEIRERYEIS